MSPSLPLQQNQALADLHLGKLLHAYWNLPPAHLVEHAIRRHEAKLTNAGALAVRTGIHTGRSPNDKFIVEDAETKNQVWWGNVNKPFAPEKFDALLQRIGTFMEGHEAYVQDLAVGAAPGYRVPIRVITQYAWHSLFAQNMFLRPSSEERLKQVPAFTVIHAPNFTAVPERDGTRSAAFVIINFTKKLVIIGGTSYAGEIKKAIFTVMNYLLPPQGVLPMHCSANVGHDGRSALFFGLSGTGKTSLSADPERDLIGDDEHGWGENGIFNFEGGCYAKVINLSQKAEPLLYAATERFGTVVENVVMDLVTRQVDYNDSRYAENTRSCYPIDYIPHALASGPMAGQGGHPKHVVMLTCDAFGVLPPISRLTTQQAMEHYLNGYTARVAGTERGVTEPSAVFSACFGAPFLPRPPRVYANLLGKLLDHHEATCWLLNTGWSGGAYGTGQRMPIATTRALLNAALSGQLDKVEYETEPFFGLSVPTSAPGVDAAVLNPRNTWKDGAAYDAAARKVAALFIDNFQQFKDKSAA
ncbi:MAG: phosphoenolpyruvate carboxykinase (ATP) [Bdellovibrionales bacterium]